MDLRRTQNSSSFLNKKIVLAVIGLLLIAGVAGVYRLVGGGDDINKDGYQLVSLTTGERFIGKLSGLDGEYVTLNDVYYQQQTDTQAAEGESAQLEAQGQITVAKLSSTVAKPEDTMQIARDKIVHWENLQDDSKIVQAIRQGSSSQ